MNHLNKEKSAYLKEAVNQSVNWYPWCEDAFNSAKKQGKPILLDIGASWCHWCHVIDHESYENKEIAEIINKNFIAVKVDRDERPDIDKIYQEVAVMISGQGGWPLTVFLTPDKIPFYAGTYFPPEDRFGLPSFKKVLLHASKVYKENKTQLVGITSQILSSIKQEKTNEVKQLKIDTLKEACIRIVNQLDHINGGFGTAPKFPNTTALQFLLIISAENNDKENLEAVKLTLRKMAEGGIYDQIGGGFHRYSTDTEWKIPHFEKLLVDNALLLELYLLAYKLSKDNSVKRIAIDIINSIKQEFYDKEGFFYASQDADVDNEEGLYFTWTKTEIEKVLNNEEAKIVSWHYGIDDIGEIDALKDKAKIRDRNVLYIENTTSAIADVLAKSEKEIANIIENAKKKLIRERGKRKKPFIDKTLYTNWNALMINSFLSAYKILGDKNYKDVALIALNFIIEKLYINGRLYHMFAENNYSVNGFLDDYQFLIQALINAHECTFESKYLDLAIELTEIAIKNFWDNRFGGFFYAQRDSKLLRNEKTYLDYSIPAGNSIAVINLLKLHLLAEKNNYFVMAEKILQSFTLADEPLYNASYYIALYMFLEGVILVKILEGKEDIEEQLMEIYSIKNSRILIKVYRREDNKPKGLKLINNKITFYVCEKGKCTNLGMSEILHRL